MDMIGHMDRITDGQTDRQSDSSIPPPPIYISTAISVYLSTIHIDIYIDRERETERYMGV